VARSVKTRKAWRAVHEIIAGEKGMEGDTSGRRERKKRIVR
jgi:hypothetical protein